MLEWNTLADNRKLKGREPWKDFFFKVAKLLSTRSTCLRRQYGAVLVRDKTIIATGFNGAPRGCQHCIDIGCARKGLKSGEKLELCRAAHAEQNCIANAARIGVSTIGTELFLYPPDIPCPHCARLLVNAGVSVIHCKQTKYPHWKLSIELFNEAGVEVLFHNG
jgi:dCMP deaminase